MVEDGRRIYSNIIASQIDIHREFGGVVPEVASRQHMLWIVPTIRRALEEADTDWNDLSGLAVTKGPGLAGSLLVGVNATKALSAARDLQFFGVNHLEGHVYANWLVDINKSEETLPPEPAFPLICLIVSGGHTDLILMKGHGEYVRLGRTRDDAAGEAFDKVARILGLSYPGGPAIQKASEGGDPESYPLPRAWLRDSYDFSFSGLKTAVLRIVEERQKVESWNQLPRKERDSLVHNEHFNLPGLAASFQEAVVDVLVKKTLEAARAYRAKMILLAGGVAANTRLREAIISKSTLPVHYPKPILCTDNAAMIASCGFYHLSKGVKDNPDMDVYPNLKLL